jgi:hypothetical protein
VPDQEQRPTSLLTRDIPIEPVFYERPRSVAQRPVATPVVVETVEEPTPLSTPPPTKTKETPGELLQRYRRSIPQAWGIFGVAMIFGIILAFTTGHHSTSKQRPTAAPAAGSRTPTAPGGQSAQQPAPGARLAPTPNTPSTTAASSSPAAASNRITLLEIKRDTGSKTTQHFVVPGPRWTLGWAYDCTSQGGSGSFKVTILNADGTPSKDGGVDQQGSKGSSVTAYTSAGERALSVQTNCLWALRVTT